MPIAPCAANLAALRPDMELRGRIPRVNMLATAGLATSAACPIGQRQPRPARRPVARPRAAADAGASPAGAGSSRRQVAALPLVALGAAGLGSLAPAALADEAPSSSGATKAYFDIQVDGKPAGRFVVEVFPDVQLGGRRFLDLAAGKDGVGYRRSKFTLIEDGFIQDAGVKSLSYRESGRTAIAGGYDLDALEAELADRRHSHDGAGVVSLALRTRAELVSKDRLVAEKGKFVVVTETLGEIPNGTAFAVTTRPEPELDDTHLAVGRVVEGREVVAALAALPRVPNNKDSPFFKAGKQAGDKRANVAEKAFNRPFARVVVAECGLL